MRKSPSDLQTQLKLERSGIFGDCRLQERSAVRDQRSA